MQELQSWISTALKFLYSRKKYRHPIWPYPHFVRSFCSRVTKKFWERKIQPYFWSGWIFTSLLRLQTILFCSLKKIIHYPNYKILCYSSLVWKKWYIFHTLQTVLCWNILNKCLRIKQELNKNYISLLISTNIFFLESKKKTDIEKMKTLNLNVTKVKSLLTNHFSLSMLNWHPVWTNSPLTKDITKKNRCYYRKLRKMSIQSRTFILRANLLDSCEKNNQLFTQV